MFCGALKMAIFGEEAEVYLGRIDLAADSVVDVTEWRDSSDSFIAEDALADITTFHNDFTSKQSSLD